MFRALDALLSRVTMYRVVLYCLLSLCAYAALLGAFGLMSFRAQDIVLSIIVITTASWGTNKLLAYFFSVDENIESSLISGLILALIINPETVTSASTIIFWLTAGFFAAASKYLIAPYKKHIFNPATFAVVATSFLLGQPASWWVGTKAMLPPVLLGGLLIVRKMRRGELVLSFLSASLILTVWKGGLDAAAQTIYFSPLFFFSFAMLTEPSTTPPSKLLRSAYGILTGILSIFMLYELALLAGNIFSYIVSPKFRFILRLKDKKQIASSETFEFSFTPDRKIDFRPGQYMEWTLKHKKPDSRGVRRYFTIASSPTEKDIKLATKFNKDGSTFKKALSELMPENKLSAWHLEGDFTLPEDKSEKLCFIAGGIGITPFRSMIKYLIDTNEKRDIVLLYSNKTNSDIVYKDIFDEARGKLGIKTVYINTDSDGKIGDKIIIDEAPDFKERTFYISGPHGMTDSFEDMLVKMDIPRSKIKTDFFPGYA